MLQGTAWKTIAKTRYVNDKQITDHYAIIPTGQTGAVRNLPSLNAKVYELIVRRFLSIFYPPAVYRKYSLEIAAKTEHFFANFKLLKEPGYLKVADVSGIRKKDENAEGTKDTAGKKRRKNGEQSAGDSRQEETVIGDEAFAAMLEKLKKGMTLDLSGLG